MSKAQRAAYLKRHGWRMVHSRKQQRWQSRSGIQATLAGAVTIQLLADMEAP
jgi:hypothetical protein